MQKITPLSFNKKIYLSQTIKKAIKVYQGLADFEIKNKLGYILVWVNNINREENSVIKDEFANYVLFLTLTKT